MARRELGKLVFLDLVDRSGRLQLFVPVIAGRESARPASRRHRRCRRLAGSSRGRGEPSLFVDSLEPLAKIHAPLPDTFHGLTDVEQRYRRRYLDLLMNDETRADFMLRARMVTAIRRALDDEGFVEVETPVLQPRYGGAFARPFSTHHNELDQTLYLRIATELYLKRLIVGGLERVYEIGKDFRNEGISFKHNPEFTMLEWYEAYADYGDTMGRMERLVARVAEETVGTTTVTFRGHEVDLVELAPAQARRRARRARPLDARRGRAACAARGARRRDAARPHLGAAGRPRPLALRRAAPDPADDPPRLPGRALAVRAHERRGGDRRALRVLRRRHGARQRVHRDQRLRASRRSASRCRRPKARAETPRPSRATPTTSRRSPTACRRRAVSGWESTGSRWCSAERTRSAT